MSQLSGAARRRRERQQAASLTFFYIEIFVGMLCVFGLIYGVYYGLNKTLGHQAQHPATAAAPEQHVQVQLKIVVNQPGYQKDWPAYTPSSIVVPAHSLVTVTIRNYDLGDTALPKGSPYNTVQGVVGGVAYTNGQSYTALAQQKVAHTFTVPQLNISVPVPGDAPKGQSYVQVSFAFHTGAAGSYYFRCFDPCGTGSIGWQGPMVTKGYMLGSLTVQ